jgi:hypothetical protein
VPPPWTLRGQLVAEIANLRVAVRPPVVHEPDDDDVTDRELGAPAARTDPDGTEREGMRRFGIVPGGARWLQTSIETVASPTCLDEGDVIDPERWTTC